MGTPDHRPPAYFRRDTTARELLEDVNEEELRARSPALVVGVQRLVTELRESGRLPKHVTHHDAVSRIMAELRRRSAHSPVEVTVVESIRQELSSLDQMIVAVNPAIPFRAFRQLMDVYPGYRVLLQSLTKLRNAFGRGVSVNPSIAGTVDWTDLQRLCEDAATLMDLDAATSRAAAAIERTRTAVALWTLSYVGLVILTGAAWFLA